MPKCAVDRRQLKFTLAAIVVSASVLWLGTGRGDAQSAPQRPRNLRVIGADSAPAAPTIETAEWDRTNGSALDLSAYQLVWADEFNAAQILAGDQSGPTMWYAGAQGGPYGAAAVDTNVRSNVYVVADGILTIRAQAETGANGARTGRWLSGHLQTVNTKGEGFAIQEGYFEARMRFPHSLGAWPAFWLKHRSKWLDPNATNIEVDVVEWYGGDWGGLHHSVHVGQGATRRYKSDYENRNPADVSNDWHTHGVLITRDSITMYFDRVRIAQFPMLDVLRQQLYPQLTLSILVEGGAVSPDAASPMDLRVDYVRVYAPKAPGR